MNRGMDPRDKTRRLGLKAKLVLSMLLVGVIPLLVGLVMAFLQGSQQIREVSGESFKALATETARKLDLVVGEEIVRTSRIANDPVIVSELEKRRDRLQDLPQDQLQTFLVENATRWQAKDQALVGTITKSKLATLLHQFYTGSNSDGGQSVPQVVRSATKGLFLTDTTGSLVASLTPDVPYANDQTPWWQGAFNRGIGHPYIEDVFFDDRVATYVFTISLPVMDSIHYEAVGVVHRVLDAKEYFSPLTHPIRFGKTGHVMLIDSRGIVMSCPILPTGVRLADAELIPLVTPIQPGWVNAPSDGHGGQTRSIIGFSILPETSRITGGSLEAGAWHTFVWQSSDELFAPVRHLLSWISVFGLIAVGLLGTLGYIAASRIVTPIRRLQEAAMLIGRGELHEPITIRTGDEIEDLAAEINRMNTQLQAAFAGLTDQVEQKTQEVQYLQKATDEILDGVPTPIIMLDPLEQVKYVNQASKQAFGLHAMDMDGASLFDVLRMDESSRERLRVELQTLEDHSDDGRDPLSRIHPRIVRAEARDPLAPQLTSASSADRKELHVGKSIYQYEWFRISTPPGETQRIGLVLRDATEEARLQDQLIHAEKLTSLGVLSAGIGHELNNPLFGVLGLGEAIQDETDLNQVKAYARDIVRHGKRMAAIIQGFTGLARVGAKEHSVLVDLNAELGQALELAQLTSEGANLEIRTDCRPLPAINARPEELRQAFTNVIMNAVQAMKGTGVLSVTTGVTDGMITMRIQ
ncbi:MAG TPA: cache domain-containing protein, partial [Nitrospiraceae bacterium]|nr:cache domain-containing protein [Nitrospiraceae bacterium]